MYITLWKLVTILPYQLQDRLNDAGIEIISRESYGLNGKFYVTMISKQPIISPTFETLSLDDNNVMLSHFHMD